MAVPLAFLPLTVAAMAAGEPAVKAVNIVDGGDVPIGIPSASPSIAPILAPEIVTDAGVEEADGGIAEIASRGTLSVYDVDIPAETAITAGSFGLYLMVDILIKPTLQGAVSCGGGQCDPNTLSAFDRYAVGRSSREWATFSDIALAGSVALPVLYLGLESLVLPTQAPFKDWFGDLLVVTESIAMTAGMDTILKFAFRRPRPDRYLPGSSSANSTFDDELSLPSGHSAVVMAATTALTTTIFFRHPSSKVRYLALVTGLLLSGLTAFARVQSGNHFPTDTITGVIVGGFAGFMVPYLHRHIPALKPAISYNAATGTTTVSVGGSL